MTTVGELNQIPGKFVVEWRTKEFLSLSPETDKFYDSPEFSFGGTRWCLRIYPNGKTKSVAENGNVVNSEGYIHLYLRRVSTGPPINMTYSLGLKTLDEGVNPERHYTHSFKEIEGYGSQGLITRSEFLERKCELLSSGVLTVVCKMKYSKSGDISNSLLTVTSRTSDSTIQIFSMTTVGELNQIPGKFVVEWRTKEFLSLSPETDKFYDSPEFSFGGTRWCLRIYPNGKTKSVAENGNVVNSEGYIHLYLRRVSTGPPINMTYSLGLKTLDEGVNPERHYTRSFKGIKGYGSQDLITRSEFLERKCELLSSGVLTVVCKMKYSKSGDISNSLLTVTSRTSDSTIQIFSMTTVGELNQIPGKFVVEWRIKEFLSLSPETDKFYDSLEFSFGGTRWCLRIYPNGKTKSVAENGNVVNSEGYIHLYLRRVSTGPPINMTYSLGLKTLDEGVNPERHYTRSFKGIKGYGSQDLITRSEFLERKCELLSSGVLTVVCKMKYSKSGDISSNTAAEKCSYCKSTLNANEDLSFHQQKCMDKPIKCPECSDIIAFKNWYDHQCQKTGAEASEKLSSDFKTLMLSGNHSDIVIKVKKEEFQLHRSILAARNPYFDSMLKNIMKKKVTGIVTIDDCEPDTFRSFIHFVYTGKVDEFSLENVCGLYEAADKYQEDQLKKECLHFMTNNLSVDSFCDYFAVALRHNENELFQKAVELFTTKGKEIARSVKWQAFVQKHPIQANELFIKTLDHYIK